MREKVKICLLFCTGAVIGGSIAGATAAIIETKDTSTTLENKKPVVPVNPPVKPVDPNPQKKVDETFEPKSLNDYGNRNFEKFINKIWSNKENLNINSFAKAFDDNFSKLNINTQNLNLYATGAQVLEVNGKKIFFTTMGNKYGEIQTLFEGFKKLNSKPGYKDFIKIYAKKPTQDISNREKLDTVMRYITGDKYKVKLEPDLRYKSSVDTRTHSLTQSIATTRYASLISKIEEKIDGKNYQNITLDKLVSALEETLGGGSYFKVFSISPNLKDEKVENLENNILKNYGYYGNYSGKGYSGYINSLGDKYNDLTDWVKKIQSLNWTSSPSYNDFINSYPFGTIFGTNKPDIEKKDTFIKIMKIALKEMQIPNILTESIKNPIRNSSAIDKYSDGSTIDHSNLDLNKKIGLSYSPVESDHRNLDETKTNPKVAFWNVLNYAATGASDDSSLSKTKGLAKVIVNAGSSIVGLGEIEGQRAPEALAKELNKIDSSSEWKFIRSGLAAYFEDGSTTVSSSSAAAEYYGFVYKGSQFTIKPFWQGTANESLAAIYKNPKLRNEFLDGEQTGYVRPPFGAQFVNKDGKDFTVVITHNDSPGYSRSSSSKGTTKEKSIPSGKGSFPSQGTQESWEALHNVDVMKWFDSIDGNNADLIFMGDTNIKYDSTLKLGKKRLSIFKPLIDSGFKALTNPLDPKHRASMGSTDYSAPYDRIFIKSPLFVEGQDIHSKFLRYDLGSIFDGKINIKDIFSQEYIESKKLKSGYWDVVNDKPTFKFVRYTIADHALISATLDLTQRENDNSTPSWNTYINNVKTNAISIPGGTSPTPSIKTDAQKVDEIYNALHDSEIGVTLTSGYDLSVSSARDDLLNKIATIKRLTLIQKGLITVETQSGTINKNTNTNVVLTITLNSVTKKATVKIKKVDAVDPNAWKDSMTFSQLQTKLKAISKESGSNTDYPKYKKVTAWAKTKGIPTTSTTTSGYNPGGKLFNMTTGRMGNILNAMKEATVTNWSTFLSELGSKWSATSGTYFKAKKGFSQLLSDVADL